MSLHNDSVMQAKGLLSVSHVQVEMLRSSMDNYSLDWRGELELGVHAFTPTEQLVIHPLGYFTHLSRRSLIQVFLSLL